MRNLIDGGDRPDEDVAFYDCIVRIIAHNYDTKKTEAVVHYLDPEYDEPISLAQIKAAYQDEFDSIYVIADSALYGSVYFWNHSEGWNKYGTTKGYA